MPQAPAPAPYLPALFKMMFLGAWPQDGFLEILTNFIQALPGHRTEFEFISMLCKKSRDSAQQKVFPEVSV
jgi:hypothetical protein